MSESEPRTRQLSRDELAHVLQSLPQSGASSVAPEPKTTLWTRGAVAARSPAPVTELDLRIAPQATRGAVAAEHTQVLPRPRARSQLRVSRSLLVPVALGLAVAGAAGWIGLRPAVSPIAERAQRLSAAVPKDLQSSRPPSLPTPQSPIGALAPSERAAVDLLLGGRLREALDAYRALALHRPSEPAFAAVAGQLERELADCAREGTSCAH